MKQSGGVKEINGSVWGDDEVRIMTKGIDG
jgi:hypothetical protein